jgi:tetratricopeptide (TPR) repeat protein
MPLSVDRALRKAQSHIKAEELAEAEELYKQVLSRFPKNKKAIQGYQKLKAGITSKGSANSEPSQEKIDELVGLYNQGQLAAVIDLAQVLTQLYPRALMLWNILGAANKGLGKLAEASNAFKKVTELDPNYADGFSNLGTTLTDQGKLEEAIEALDKALKIKPDYAEANSNMGNALKEKGDLDGAIDSYKQALKIRPDYADCFINCDSILVQVSDVSSLDGKLNPSANKRLKSLLSENPRHQIQQSIQYFLQCDCEASKNTLIKYKALVDAGKTKDLDEEDQVFCGGYASFIDQLIKKCPTPQPFNENKIYHVGESHCLSYAHHSLILEQQTFGISPKITFGAKAYHFSKSDGNAFKSITQRNLDAIPNGSLV